MYELKNARIDMCDGETVQVKEERETDARE